MKCFMKKKKKLSENSLIKESPPRVGGKGKGGKRAVCATEGKNSPKKSLQKGKRRACRWVKGTEGPER